MSEYFTCDNCKVTDPKERELTQVKNFHGEKQYWCADCVDSQAYFCNCCRDYYTADAMAYTTGNPADSHICNDCRDNHIACAVCGRFILYDDACCNDDDEDAAVCCKDCQEVGK